MNRRAPTVRSIFLKKNADFERVKLNGKRWKSPLFTIVWHVSGEDRLRVGIITGRRLGKAVVRNRAKRIFRELVRATPASFGKGLDVIVYPRIEALSMDARQLNAAWRDALGRVRAHAAHAVTPS